MSDGLTIFRRVVRRLGAESVGRSRVFACSAVLRVSPSEYDTNLISEKGRLHGSCVMGWDICMGSQQKMLTCALVLKNGTVVTQRGTTPGFTLGRHANVYCEALGRINYVIAARP